MKTTICKRAEELSGRLCRSPALLSAKYATGPLDRTSRALERYDDDGILPPRG